MPGSDNNDEVRNNYNSHNSCNMDWKKRKWNKTTVGEYDMQGCTGYFPQIIVSLLHEVGDKEILGFLSHFNKNDTEKMVLLIKKTNQ